MFGWRRRVSRQRQRGLRDQGGTLCTGILVKHEDGEDIAEKHATGNQSDASEDEEAARAHGSEGGDDHRAASAGAEPAWFSKEA